MVPDGLTVLLPVLGVLSVVVVAMIFGIRAANKAEVARRKAIQEFCAAREFFDVPTTNASGWLQLMKTLTEPAKNLAEVLRHRKIQPISTSGYSLVDVLLARQLAEQFHYLLTYYYVVSTGKSTTVIYVDMLVFQVPLAFPAFSIRPQGGMDRFVEAFGLRDIQFESKEFNDRFFVRLRVTVSPLTSSIQRRWSSS